MKAFGILPLILLGAAPAMAQADAGSALAGGWEAAEGPDVAAQLVLRADGRFDYALAAGALDERASGRWVRDGPFACLTTEPTPTPPQFVRQQAPADGPTVKVVWPNGRGIAGVDLRVGMEGGAVVDGYTQTDGWSLPADATGNVAWIELVEPMHAISSPRFTLQASDHGRLMAVLQPNDLGVVDFRPACLEPDGKGGAVLHRAEGDFQFRRAED